MQTDTNFLVGLSGVLLVNKGTIEAVKPSILQTPLIDKIDKWDNKYKVSAPLVVYSTMFNFNELDIKLDNEMRTNEEMVFIIFKSLYYIFLII